ncbi:MAG TPA: hypothetical protein VMG14_01530 [Thermoplasmata archaeon]|jgi:FKBP-type peptidyl-prolyl cis-trans isomerase 2|nr:hypothetical protein [Thermoplasmata archaeon]
MAEPKPPRMLALVLAILVIVAGAVGAGVLYYENHKYQTSAPLTVQIGDNVTVNYIGIFGSSPQVGRVFDTSYYSVATNNLTWPKAIGYTGRGPSPSNYTPLPVAVGPNVPSGGYTFKNWTFGSVVTGFWKGLIGLPGNQTRYITVPPSQGYGLANQSCFVSQPLSYSLPVTAALSVSAFSALFPGVSHLAGTEFTDPTYRWTDYIVSVNATSIVYSNLATLGWSASPQGWPVVVTNLTTTTITLTNQLSATNAGLVGGSISGSGVCGSTSFIVSQVNLATGTYVEDFNEDVVGQTLIFAVVVEQIFPPS